MRRRTVRRGRFARTEIPDAIQRDLDAIGGVPGLCSGLPDSAAIRHESAIHHALSDPVRLRILHLVGVQPLCVCVIKACIGIADSKLSYHLAILKRAGLIEGTQQGNWIIYSITGEGREHLR
jgi:ArsR family transcriptional regulator, arsenate/arsenite/antimonite-responsive transcriptional repressor